MSFREKTAWVTLSAIGLPCPHCPIMTCRKEHEP